MRMPKWLKNLEHHFSNFKWYRKWYGGKWELWWVDSPIGSEVWHNMSLYKKRWLNYKPSPLCRGKAIKIEDYTSILYYHLHGEKL